MSPHLFLSSASIDSQHLTGIAAELSEEMDRPGISELQRTRGVREPRTPRAAAVATGSRSSQGRGRQVSRLVQTKRAVSRGRRRSPRETALELSLTFELIQEVDLEQNLSGLRGGAAADLRGVGSGFECSDQRGIPTIGRQGKCTDAIERGGKRGVDRRAGSVVVVTPDLLRSAPKHNRRIVQWIGHPKRSKAWSDGPD